EWQGLKNDSLEDFQALVHAKKEFHSRSLMESNDEYKQIIPYLIFRHKQRYFLMQRASKAGEQRLKNKHSLGIGGHVRRDDFLSCSSLIGWAQREFEEEIAYKGTYRVKPLGLLNDDSNSVGRVHVGCVLLLEGDSDDISVKSELKSGMLLPVEEIKKVYASLETWSQIVFDSL
nr:hypothetical protein [Candidatus Dependentiae bacterium]